ncbi:MAG: anti-sigma factor [Chloroflexales bacterium]|nr:anti-sigma factor [Chloroflexales bacterium]
MTTPPELLEQSLDAHGDTLYWIALVVAGDERRAAALLRDMMSPDALEAGGAAPDEPALMARLAAAARRQEEREAGRGGRARGAARVNLFAPFAIHSLPLDQRLALALYLLLGYDGARLAGALGGDEASARAALIAGARGLGPAVGATLTDRVSGEQCAAARDALIDPVATARHSTVRGHLATCAPCRAFDQAWGTILPAVEGAMRAALRERTLPQDLRAKLLARAGWAGGQGARSWRLTRVALAPLGVLALIAVLVLPGFMREPVSVVERGQSPPVDAQALIAKALARQTAPPERSGVWRGRYETLWFFDNDVYAPMRADIWLDPHTPARHRLQLMHRDGGAPYELQIGDGEGRLAYALDAAYAPSLYGALPLGAMAGQPALIDQPLSPEGQVRARDERMLTGPWTIPAAYLRQAQRATDLRLLGRQRESGRVVQILSFSGFSPLGLPPDAPGATAERVTVLLALDSEDGLLRGATELMGPAGAAQTSRVTWRLVEEQWLTGGEQIRETFDVERAWTGIGDFSAARRSSVADLAVPLVSWVSLGEPAGLLTLEGGPLWLPSRPPAGVDRALLVWGEGAARVGASPLGLIYLGQGRRLVLALNQEQALDGEHLAVGPWRVSLRPGHGQRYTAFLARPAGDRQAPLDVGSTLLIDAYGFTRAELLDVIEGMRPFDLESLAAQESLFQRPGAGDPEARSAGRYAAGGQVGPVCGCAVAG